MSNVFSSQGRIGQGLSAGELRLKLLQNGYGPVPVKGKNPSPIIGWNAGPVTPERIAHDIEAYQSHRNTGLLTALMPTIDIDLWDDEHVVAIGGLVADRLKLSPLLRRGRKGLAMCYRLDGKPVGSLIIRADTGERTAKGAPIYRTLVEILCRGRQVVAYGDHPDTGKPYEWVGDSEPLRTRLGELPAVTPNQLRDLAQAIREECARLGYNTNSVRVQGGEPNDKPPPKTGMDADALDVTEMFLSLIRGGKRSSTGYINFPCPACCHKDHKSGLQVLANGGFVFKCFHASCEYSKATGWQPPNRVVGDRVKHLYELLGGNPAGLRFQNRLCGYVSLADMLADFNHPCPVNQKQPQDRASDQGTV
jgi:Bifunctional DNA primase/polymerase, N-terminal